MTDLKLDSVYLALLLLIPLILYVYYKYLQPRQPALLVTGVAKDNRAQKIAFSPPSVFIIIRSLTVLFVVTGLVNLQSATKTKISTATEESDIVLALDLSKSMQIEDIKPNRLEALRNVLNAFIATRTRDRIGIVLYAGESLSWCPLTSNRALLLNKINTMGNPELADGTAIGVGLSSAVLALEKSKAESKVIILITDGENNAGFIHPLTAAAIAKKNNVKVYTIGIGSTGMANLPVTDMNGKKSYVQIKASIDAAMLGKIAAETGGEFFKATDATALKNIYKAIDKQQGKKYKDIIAVSYQAFYRIFIYIAIALLLLEVILKFTYLRIWPI
jgi:Ca-activated chloride channel family protein